MRRTYTPSHLPLHFMNAVRACRKLLYAASPIISPPPCCSTKIRTSLQQGANTSPSPSSAFAIVLKVIVLSLDRSPNLLNFIKVSGSRGVFRTSAMIASVIPLDIPPANGSCNQYLNVYNLKNYHSSHKIHAESD